MSKWYPGEDVKTHFKRRQKAPKPTKLRRNITAGTVLILLSGRFRGRRVVFLKQLKSGLLLVSGPYKVNGVPLKRVNQAYCIPTSTKVSLDGVDCTDVDDEFFGRKRQKRKRRGEQEYFNTGQDGTLGGHDAGTVTKEEKFKK